VLHAFRSAPCNTGESGHDVSNEESKNRLTNVGQDLLALGLLVLLADLRLVRGAILGVAGGLLLLVLQPLLQQAVPNCDTRGSPLPSQLLSLGCKGCISEWLTIFRLQGQKDMVVL